MITTTLARAEPLSARPGLALRRLALTDFRNYRHLRLELDGGPVVLTGPNGAGKTNLLEAVSFLAPGRGLRRARLSELDRIGPSPLGDDGPPNPSGAWAVAATVRTAAGEVELATGRDLGESGEGERRLVRIAGVAARSQAALADHVTAVWLTPQMDGLFREGASGRRRFLDRLVYAFDADHARRLSAYEHAMRERARLLRGGRHDAAWLAALEEAMATNGVAVAAARRDAVGRIDAACAVSDGPFPAAVLGLQGTIDERLSIEPALAAEDWLRASLAAGRRQDGEAGGAAEGPHRSDLAVRHRAKDVPASLCSTGEQKALLVSIVLAHARLLAAERGSSPLLLLDEVAAHLDRARAAALFDEVAGLGGQAWLTGTDATSFDGLVGRAQFLPIADGRLVGASPS